VSDTPSSTDLEAWLDESLPAAEMARIEAELRTSATLREEVQRRLASRESGVHTLGAIWRRHRVTCASREELAEYLAGKLEIGPRDYLQFHLETIGCRFCQANLEDLRAEQKEGTARQVRRKKFFDSSAGLLRP
jgi:hypothetical protein